MEAALPRLAVQPIPGGPPMPEGWQAPDPVGELLSGLGDGMGEDPGGQPSEPVDPSEGDPYVEPSRPSPQPSPGYGPPVVRPTSPQPAPSRGGVEIPPPNRPEPERRPGTMFF